MNTEWIIFLFLLSFVLGSAAVWLGQWWWQSSSSPASHSLAEVPPQSQPEAEALVLGPLDNPLMEIYRASEDSSFTQIEVSSAMKTALAPILQRAPDMLSVGGNMAAKGYRVVFSPQVTRALSEGTAELLPSAGALLPVARDVSKGKKFVEIGRVAKDGGIKLASMAAMSWQVLSIVTAQHFLNEINARLAGIESGINDIRTWLEEDKKAQLKADLRYLQEVSSALSRGQLHADEVAAFYGQLDDIERRACGIGELAKEMTKHRMEHLEKLDIREWSDRAGSAHRAREWISHLKEVNSLALMAQAVRLLNCQVKAILPGDRQRLQERITHIKQEAANAQSLFASPKQRFLEKVHELRKRHDNFWTLGGAFDEDYQSGLKHDFEAACDTVGQTANHLTAESEDALKMGRRIHALGESAMELEIRLDEKGEMQVFVPMKHAA